MIRAMTVTAYGFLSDARIRPFMVPDDNRLSTSVMAGLGPAM